MKVSIEFKEPVLDFRNTEKEYNYFIFKDCLKCENFNDKFTYIHYEGKDIYFNSDNIIQLEIES